jgi:hypothetical protein
MAALRLSQRRAATAQMHYACQVRHVLSMVMMLLCHHWNRGTCAVYLDRPWNVLCYTPQGGFALIDDPSPHVLKQLQRLLYRAVPPGAWPPLFPASTMAYISMPLANVPSPQCVQSKPSCANLTWHRGMGSVLTCKP